MATSYSSWYKVGLVKVTNGSKTITGTGTYWLSAGIAPGDIFTLNGYHIFEIEEVLSDTQINLVEAWASSTQSNQSYAIIRNTSRTMNSKIALQTADLHNTFKRYIDTEHKTITGKSAYEVARDNGYTGTAAQWLESLKAAGDYTKLLDKVNVFDYDNAGLHNSIYRGKNLGTVITDEQLNNIKNGTFKDMWLGDYWEFPLEMEIPDLSDLCTNSYAKSYATGGKTETFRAIIAGFCYQFDAGEGYAHVLQRKTITVVCVNQQSHTLSALRIIHDWTTFDGFANSIWYTTIRPILEEGFREYFNDHLIPVCYAMTNDRAGTSWIERNYNKNGDYDYITIPPIRTVIMQDMPSSDVLPVPPDAYNWDKPHQRFNSPFPLFRIVPYAYWREYLSGRNFGVPRFSDFDPVHGFFWKMYHEKVTSYNAYQNGAGYPNTYFLTFNLG